MTTIVQVYTLTNIADDKEKIVFASNFVVFG